METSESVTRSERVAFELERIEWIDDRCEVEGRWFGVRGRRFLRPALILAVDGSSTRLLAELTHKPWAAEEGEPWIAAFPGAKRDGEIEAVELTVAPDINVPLPSPGATPARRRKAPARAASPAGPKAARSSNGAGTTRPRSKTRDEQARRQQQLDQAKAVDQAKAIDQAKAENAQAAARIDKLLDELNEGTRQRDEARTAQREIEAERDQAMAERDRALAERDRALAERDVALADREASLAERDKALAERDAVLTQQAEALAARDAALEARGRALAQRDKAVNALNQASDEHETLARTNQHLQAELTDLTATRGAAMAIRQASYDGPVSRTGARFVPRLLAVIALLAIIVALLIILRGA